MLIADCPDPLNCSSRLAFGFADYVFYDFDHIRFQAGEPGLFNTIDNYVEKLRLSSDRHHSLRLEARTWLTDDLSSTIDILRKVAEVNASHFFHLKTTPYTAYLSMIIQTSKKITQGFVKSVNIPSLNGLLFLSYVLSSIMGSPPKRYSVKFNGVNKHFNLQPLNVLYRRNLVGKSSSLFKWPNLFTLEGGQYNCRASIDFTDLQAMYPHIQLYQHFEQANILSLSTESLLPREFTFVNWYKHQDISAQKHIDLVLNVFKTYGFSDLAVNIFACIFFKEYFGLLPESLFKQTTRRPGIAALCEIDEVNQQEQDKLSNMPKWNTGFNAFTKMEIAMKNLMPLPSRQASKEEIISLITMDPKSKWIKFGSRSILLQCFIDNNIEYQHMKDFYARFYTLCFCYLRWIPKTDKLKICHMSQGNEMDSDKKTART
ncbi:hypothetical protein EDC96DRAFT_550056 [Choanephora cucurbitarum]|nr:hypothetical protein EDC96DRAFT_550056 [Choanephora cucurbitarum]